MNVGRFRQRLKPWMLPIAMVGGILLHDVIDAVAFVAPYLIFLMLFITYCKVTPREFRVTRLTWLLLAVQIGGSFAAYAAFLPAGVDVAQGAFISVFCPTATAAPVITGMLGGSVATLATYSIVSNLAVAATAPVIFAVIGTAHELTLAAVAKSSLLIACRVMPIIILPLLLALLLWWRAPRVHHAVGDRQAVSFYIWAVSLFIVVGRAVSFVMGEPADRVPEMLMIAGAALAVCCLQFGIGRILGRRYGDRIAGAQGLGQKNTVLAIWMALTWLNPIASVGPAAYILWQNIINSTQLYFHERNKPGA